MTQRTPDSIFRDVVRDPEASIKSRIAALEAIQRPSVRFLASVAGDESGPSRLRVVAVERLEHLIQLRKAIKRLRRAEVKEEVRDEQGRETKTGSNG